jgi:hypothetical protein
MTPAPTPPVRSPVQDQPAAENRVQPQISRVPLQAAGRLLRLELRRNAMLWMLPLLAALFWVVVYRRIMALPPLWNVRAMTMQTATVTIFVPTVMGAAAWMGSREGRHGMSDLIAGTARARWVRQLAIWAATTCWAIVAYLACVGVAYGITARQGAWGGPLWWPVAVGIGSLPAMSALGFAAGAWWPSRFTTPLVAIGGFFALELSLNVIHGSRSAVQISPLVAGPWELGGSDLGVATFYPYLPDLPIAQLMFLAGLTAALLGVLGLSAGSGGRTLRRSAAVSTTAGLLVVGTAVALAGTARLDPHGMIAIPLLHDAADDHPIPYTPVCSRTAIPVCVNPAYAVYLPAVSAALAPVLAEVAGLPGAPVRVSQGAATYRQRAGNEVEIDLAGPADSGDPPELRVLLAAEGPALTAGGLASAMRADIGREIVTRLVVGDRAEAGPAQRAVMSALLQTPSAGPAQRFAALPAATRHAWLVEHLDALRAGRITLAQLP